jgi:DNA polymerase-3 subunit alpha
VHSEYSLLDGSAKIKELIARTKELGMSAIALTDHGVMYGVIDFYKEAIANGIKPIIGCEVYVASGSRLNKENSKDNFYYHLVLLVKNQTGFHNLMKLSSIGFTEGFYYKPRVDLEVLEQYKDGLIALSACMSGPVAKTFLRSGYPAAAEMAQKYADIFGKDNFYLELQDHGIKAQRQINTALIKMSKELDIPLVCTNDSHYIYASDAKAHEILLCIQTGKTINDSDRMIYEGEQFYLKSPEEMWLTFGGYIPEAIENTSKIADQCEIEIKFNEYKLPKFTLPPGEDAFAYLKKLCSKGLRRRYGERADRLFERLNYELSVIANMGFVDYFLITWDFIRYAKKNGIMVGPGRGSASGSIASYCLGITNIDPLKYDLLFERFLNPERVSMPDIDIDFCYERRQEVIDYVIEKYGADHVTQIITFGTMGAKAVIRDVGRALAMPYADVDRIAKMIPFELNMTIKRAMELNLELKKAFEEEDDTKNLIEMALRLEGLPRHASTHAAGVVICDKPVMEYVPLNQNDGVITTQFSMTTIEELGLLKMDFLGLRTLTVIQNAVREIKRGKNININIDRIDLDNPYVYELISAAKTEGVFQLESSGMKSFMRELAPSRLEDIIAGISLYRPGPMDFIPKYIKGKNNPDKIEYSHPALEPILSDTYGCIVYQEQVIRIVRELAGYSLARSDLVRRAMSKKKTEVMNRERDNFVEGCAKSNISKDVAEHIFDEMIDFGRYAFNKSHAAAYAVVGYQTAWLKVFFPVEFMAAAMTSVMDFTSKLVQYVDECKKMGILILPPDINESFSGFSVSGENIRFGLAAIKGVGGALIDSIVRERENAKFTSLTEFISRMDGKDMNKRCIESFIKAGAFDSFGGKRIQYMTVYKGILDGINGSKKRNIVGQISLFELDETGFDIYKDELPRIEEYSNRQLLAYEKEVLGVYVSGHPLSEFSDKFEGSVKNFSYHFTQQNETTSKDSMLKDSMLKDFMLKDNEFVSYGGMISSKTVKYTRNGGKAMAFLTVEDMYGSVEVIVFSQLYEKFSSRLSEDAVIIVSGKASVREDEDIKIVANDINFLNISAVPQVG